MEEGTWIWMMSFFAAYTTRSLALSHLGFERLRSLISVTLPLAETVDGMTI
jgi:hypothetical protein